MFYSTAEFPFLKILEQNREVILSEYLASADKSKPWFETNLHNGKWRTYGIKFKGENIDNECPETTKLVNQLPRTYIAGFSTLKSGCKIHPHTGYTGDVWRAHLGLVCPDNCWIKVGGEEYRWKEGEVVVFDDTILHEAANESDTDRVVLIVDFYKEQKSD
jgi:aspartyl/asparaginyl beta-hydroxylase (cupin superfamily)